MTPLRRIHLNRDVLFLTGLQYDAVRLLSEVSIDLLLDSRGQCIGISALVLSDLVLNIGDIQVHRAGVGQLVADLHLAVVRNECSVSRILRVVSRDIVARCDTEDVLLNGNSQLVGACVVRRRGRRADHAARTGGRRDNRARNRSHGVRGTRNGGLRNGHRRNRYRRHNRACHVDVVAAGRRQLNLDFFDLACSKVEGLDVFQLILDRLIPLAGVLGLGDLIGDGHTLDRGGAGIGDDVGDGHLIARLNNVTVVVAVDDLLDVQLRRVRPCIIRRGGNGNHLGRDAGARDGGVRVRGARDLRARDRSRRHRHVCNVVVAAGRGFHRDADVTVATRLKGECRLGLERCVDLLLQLVLFGALGDLVDDLDVVHAHLAGVADTVEDLHVFTRHHISGVIEAVDVLLDLQLRAVRIRRGGHRGARDFALRNRGFRTSGTRNRCRRNDRLRLVLVRTLRRVYLDPDIVDGTRSQIEDNVRKLVVDLLLQLVVVFLDLVGYLDAGQCGVTGVADAVPQLHFFARLNDGLLTAINALLNIQTTQLYRRADDVVFRTIRIALHRYFVDQARVLCRILTISVALANGLRQGVRSVTCNGAGNGDAVVLHCTRGEIVATGDEIFTLLVGFNVGRINLYGVNGETVAYNRNIANLWERAINFGRVANADDVLSAERIVAVALRRQVDCTGLNTELLDCELWVDHYRRLNALGVSRVLVRLNWRRSKRRFHIRRSVYIIPVRRDTPRDDAI